MKATYEHIEPDRHHSSFTAYWRRTDCFDFNWHYHPETELTYIHQGQGTRLVGDHVEGFSDGDLVLLGPDLPHTWASESKGREQAAIVVQFSPALTAPLLQAPEFANIRLLLERAERGISFGLATSAAFAPKMSAMLDLEGMPRLTELWRILDALATAPHQRLLASPIYQPSHGQENEQRIGRVYQHIHQHFTKKISLREIAGIALMTEPAFCRFFKKMTGKPFVAYLNDLRASHARRLLQESQMPISEIAFRSGFESSTHFNRVFFQMNGKSPRDFRRGVLWVQGG